MVTEEDMSKEIDLDANVSYPDDVTTVLLKAFDVYNSECTTDRYKTLEDRKWEAVLEVLDEAAAQLSKKLHDLEAKYHTNDPDK